MYNVSKAFEDFQVLDHFTYTFKKQDRIGIVGPNGVGKSTFLDLLTSKEEPDTGSVRYGETTRFGFYSQLQEPVPENLRVIEAVRDFAETFDTEDGRTLRADQFLDLFLFPRAKQHDFVHKLSGGERKRLKLLKVLIKNPNFLILDEPTNDLDIDTLNVLEQFLKEYDGTLLIVSHDRYFLDQLVDHLFVFEGKGKVRDFPGNYTDFIERKKTEEAAAQKAKTAEKKKKSGSNRNQRERHQKTKLSFNEQRELEKLDKEIPKLEERKEELARLMSSGETDHEKLEAWGKEAHELNEAIESKTERWMELSEYL